MDLKCKMIMEEYREQRKDFMELDKTVYEILSDITKKSSIDVLAIEHRVKAENSLAGKLELKGEKYFALADITDILGARIVCFFSDDVYNIAHEIEKIFEVDWDNSVDKGAVIAPDNFGYLSLHYICSIPFGKGYPDNICGKKFEIQIRTTLQHTWAVIEHDLGYKSEFGVPRAVIRGFAQIAGLLEIADEKFVELRDTINEYSDSVREKIRSGEAQSLAIDRISLNEYMKINTDMRAFIEELASFNENCEISDISADIYLEQLHFLGVRTLGDLEKMFEENRELATELAKKTFEITDLDIISSNVALRFLCRAKLLNDHADLEKVTDFMNLTYANRERSERMARRLLKND